MKNITKVSQAKFKISTVDVTGSELLLDFNPIIDEFKLVGDFYLIHWQARPKGHRQWGIYNSSNDTYTSMLEPPKSYGSMQYLMLDDATAKTIPSAVILFVGYLKL